MDTVGDVSAAGPGIDEDGAVLGRPALAPGDLAVGDVLLFAAPDPAAIRAFVAEHPRAAPDLGDWDWASGAIAAFHRLIAALDACRWTHAAIVTAAGPNPQIANSDENGVVLAHLTDIQYEYQPAPILVMRLAEPHRASAAAVAEAAAAYAGHRLAYPHGHMVPVAGLLAVRNRTVQLPFASDTTNGALNRAVRDVTDRWAAVRVGRWQQAREALGDVVAAPPPRPGVMCGALVIHALQAALGADVVGPAIRGHHGWPATDGPQAAAAVSQVLSIIHAKAYTVGEGADRQQLRTREEVEGTMLAAARGDVRALDDGDDAAGWAAVLDGLDRSPLAALETAATVPPGPVIPMLCTVHDLRRSDLLEAVAPCGWPAPVDYASREPLT